MLYQDPAIVVKGLYQTCKSVAVEVVGETETKMKTLELHFYNQ